MTDRAPRRGHEMEIGASQALQPHPHYDVANPAHAPTTGAGGGPAQNSADHHHRRHRGDLEIGDTQVLRKHPTPHLAGTGPPISPHRLAMEERRPMWLRECIAEAVGVFCYVYCGTAANATLFLSTAAEEPAYGNLLTVGLAFGIGIAFALITSATTSGGHFNPAVTLCFATFSGFPWRKVPRYILSQVFGAMLASIFVYAQYHQQLQGIEAALTAAGKPLLGATGPAGIFASFPNAGQSLGNVFINEFLADAFIGLIIVSVLDPCNNFMSPVMAPWAIGLAYTVMVWGFALGTISTNTARDLGARFGAACFYGSGMLTVDKSYVAISALTNIPATFLAFAFYQLVMQDSFRLIDDGHATHPEVYKTLTREREAAEKNGVVDEGHSSSINGKYSGKNDAEVYHSNYASSAPHYENGTGNGRV